MIKTCFKIAPLFLFLCSCSSIKESNKRSPNVFQITDGYFWSVQNRREGDKRLSSITLPFSNKYGEWDVSNNIDKIIGDKKDYSLYVHNNNKHSVQLITRNNAEFYKFDSTNNNYSNIHSKKFNDCNGYPSSSIRISFKTERGVDVSQTGYALPKNSVLYKSPAKEFPRRYSIYKESHEKFVRKSYTGSFSPYGETIDLYSVAIKAPNGDIYFIGVSPDVDEDKHPIYVFRKGSIHVERIDLPGRVRCAS